MRIISRPSLALAQSPRPSYDTHLWGTSEFEKWTRTTSFCVHNCWLGFQLTDQSGTRIYACGHGHCLIVLTPTLGNFENITKRAIERMRYSNHKSFPQSKNFKSRESPKWMTKSTKLKRKPRQIKIFLNNRLKKSCQLGLIALLLKAAHGEQVCVRLNRAQKMVSLSSQCSH